MEVSADPRLSEVEIARAGTDDLETVLKLWLEAANWLESKGISQWKPNSFTIESVKEHAAKTELFVARLNKEIVATFSLQWSDAFIWRELNSEDCGYLHRLVVARSYKSHNLGRLLLSWAEKYITDNGKSKLRLDCMADNEKLNEYYRGSGFDFVGRIDRTYFSASLYEKVIK